MTQLSTQESWYSDRRSANDRLVKLVEEFGYTVSKKIGRGGGSEDQLRGPVEVLLRGIGAMVGLETIAYGEVSLKDLRARPDYAVDVGHCRIGYIELKPPGSELPPNWRPRKRDHQQWLKLTALPNLIYTNGISWQRYSYGEPAGQMVRLAGSLTEDKGPVRPVDHQFESLMRDFLLWQPEQPRTLKGLIKIVARLCRLLRDEVLTILTDAHHHSTFEDLTLLANDWRDLLFPDLDDVNFADAYAQTITFAFLLARADGISFESTSVHEIARRLRKKHTLMGKALEVLTNSDATEELRTVDTLRRVIGAVNWEQLDDGSSNIFVELYESFLAFYDPCLRKESGTYYTPEPVARFMVNFVDAILRDRLGRRWGFAENDVFVIDPAMGTGTFLVEIVRAVADTVDRKQGVGARPARIRELVRDRLVGFERQVAPYAVAELRLHQALSVRFGTDIPRTEVRFLTDALEDPRGQQTRFPVSHKDIERAHTEANRIKREVPVMVVIGNPPHVGDARGRARWIEERRRSGAHPLSILTRPSMDDFRLPGEGRYESDLHAMQWYFWRWALWKVFDAHPDHPAGVVAFISPSSYLTGVAYRGMRSYLRRTCDEGWIIDLSPEGNRSDSTTRVFGAAVSRQLSIGVFIRRAAPNERQPADVRVLQLRGSRQEKLDQLAQMALDDRRWQECPPEWSAPFQPRQSTAWSNYPSLSELMPWTSRGVTTGRRWVYAPDADTLNRRWSRLVRSGWEERRALFREGRDRRLTSRVVALPGFPTATKTIGDERGDMPAVIRVGYRSFDRQYLIADNRLMEVPRPPLWHVRSNRQIYVTEQSSHPIESGPGLTFTADLPDIHHYNGRGGRVLPLYRDAAGTEPNITPPLLAYLSAHMGMQVVAEDFVAYTAVVVAHGGYTRRFRNELRVPGIRVPITAVPELWRRAVETGQKILWLHTYGERLQHKNHHCLRDVVERAGPKVIKPIPDSVEGMPEEYRYDSAAQTLFVGSGAISPVSDRVWRYDVGGRRVLTTWLDSRLKQPRYRRRTSPLDDLNCERWTPAFTDELLRLVTVLQLCVDLEPAQDRLLFEILKGRLITRSDLSDAGILPVPASARRPPATTSESLMQPDLLAAD